MDYKKRSAIVLGVLILLFVLSFSKLHNFPLTGEVINTPEITQITPLNPEEIQRIQQTILSNEIIKDIPEKYPVFLRFFKIEKDQKIWQDGFLIGKNKILTKGDPLIYITINSEYLNELNRDFCSTIQKAYQNKDIGIYSDYSKVSLSIKYFSMIKHRDCIGF